MTKIHLFDIVYPSMIGGWSVADVRGAWILGKSAKYAIVTAIVDPTTIRCFFPEHCKSATIHITNAEKTR